MKIMRRRRLGRLTWGARLSRGRANARLAHALELAEEIRDTKRVAWALVGRRDGTLALVEVEHDTGARTVRAVVSESGKLVETAAGLRGLGLARVVLRAMGFGRR